MKIGKTCAGILSRTRNSKMDGNRRQEIAMENLQKKHEYLKKYLKIDTIKIIQTHKIIEKTINNNYRAICLSSVRLKTYTKIIKSILIKIVET